MAEGYHNNFGSYKSIDNIVTYDSSVTGNSNITIYGGAVARLTLEFTKSNLTSGATIGYIDGAYLQKGGRITTPVVDDGAGTVSGGSLYINFGATGLGIRYYGPTTSNKLYAECTYILNNPIN